MSVIDAIKGVFIDSPADKETKANLNTPEQQKLVDVAINDYPTFRVGRQGIEDTWRTEDRIYEGGKRQWEGLRSEATMKNRPNSADNIAFSQIESIVSALTGWTPEGKYLATEDGDEPKAQELAKFMPWELRQIKFKAKYTKAVRRFVNHGLFLLKQVHDPTVEGGRGQNRWIGQNDVIPLDFGSFFPDPRIGDLMYIQKSKAMILKYVHDIEYFPERFGEQGKKVQPDDSSDDVKIFEEDRMVSENTFNTTYGGENKRERSQTAGLYEYWYKGKPKIMTDKDKEAFKELAELKLSESKDPSEALAKAEGKMKGIHCIYVSTTGVFLGHNSYVYDHGQYPVTVRCLFTVEGSIWPKGYMRDLISPQIMLNKFSELAVEQTAKMGNGAVMYEDGAIAESKIPIWKRIRSTVGAMLPVLRLDGVKEIEGKGPPPMIMTFIQHWMDILQKIPRRFDNSNGGAAFQGESGKHAEALQAAAQGNLSTPTELIEDGLAETFEQLIELVAQFYPTERIGRVLGKKFSMSRNTLVSGNMVDFETDKLVDDGTGKMVPEVIQVQEEYVPKFDISVSIGVERPTDREYWVNLAFTLLEKIDPLTGMPMIDTQGVQYTIENGRMEPFEVIQERMQADQIMQQKMQELEQENAVLTEQVNQMGEMIHESNGANSASDGETLKTLQDGDKMQRDHVMNERKQTMAESDQKERHANEKIKLMLEAKKIEQAGKQKVTAGAKNR